MSGLHTVIWSQRAQSGKWEEGESKFAVEKFGKQRQPGDQGHLLQWWDILITCTLDVRRKALYLWGHPPQTHDLSLNQSMPIPLEGWPIKQWPTLPNKGHQKQGKSGASLEAQWLRVHLPAQGVQGIPGHGAEIPTCLRAKKPKHKTEAIL